MGEFGASRPVARREDRQLLRGRGRFTDDRNLPDLAHAHVLRSPHGHARIGAIDTTRAMAAPGILAVLTGADYQADGLGALPHIGPPVTRRGGSPAFVPPFAALTRDRARFVGDAVAVIVAENRDAARDAAEMIEIRYEPLPAVTESIEAVAEGSTDLWPQAPGNECFVHQIGDKPATEAAFAAASHVIRQRFVISRVLANAMECRGCIADYDGREERYFLNAPIQHPFVARKLLAENILGVPETRVRVVTEDVGGSFGIKANIYPEYILALWASKRIGRPVKWISDRSEGHLSDFHARDNVSDAELALDGDGKFLGFRLRTLVNLGAYLSTLASGPATNNLGTLSGVYTTPAAHVEVVGVFTNTQPTAPYRGAGRPEAAYVIERMVDLAARELGIPAAEIRRRNIIPPDAMPYKTALTFTYDSGAFEHNMDDALKLIDADGYGVRRAQSESRGRLRGLGLAYAIERAAPPGLEYAEIRFDPTGNATVLSGTTSQGQGHATTYTQLLCDRLGLAPEMIDVIEGDTDRIAFGFGSGGSRSAAMGGAAVILAADKIIEKARNIAAHMLETSEADIAFADGRFTVSGTDRSLPLGEIVKRAFVPAQLPDHIEPGLYECATYRGRHPSYPNGCHACEIEIDPETGALDMLRYIVVDDFGTLINPLLVKGQVHGGIAQGAGQVLMEKFVYDHDSGQVLSGSFMDYAMPRADDFCNFEVQSNPVPTGTNPLGVKGAGEAGAVGALPAVMNAIVDALAPLGIHHVEMPASPQRIWETIRNTRSSS
jgi:aerobic carbon-monoxide dehydrogenase large subunit